ncbi:MAG: DUF348 domain-containing protein [Candidatus Moranbacteria bacterium]|nr:DUF348 domain-containing protein [Candidatus Moranbacteria bacterium]
MKIAFQKYNKAQKILYVFAVFFFCAIFFAIGAQADNFDFAKNQKRIVLQDDGMTFESSSETQTVEEFFNEKKITLQAHDLVFPDKNEKIFSGTKIIILRAKEITIKEGKNTDKLYTFANTVEQAIWADNKIELDQDDVTVPDRSTPIKDGMVIVVTHVLIKEEVKNVDIDFKTISNEDDKLGWRVKKVTQKGETGIKEVKYKIVYNDGKEISRKILESNVTKNPIEEIVTQGTLVKVGKVHTGAASWYAWTGTMAAANPWLPMGSYVRVTNQDNGKSVIVKINDRGPFGNGRIIDLDKVAFAQIAPIGQGTANIKMEVITN